MNCWNINILYTWRVLKLCCHNSIYTLSCQQAADVIHLYTTEKFPTKKFLLARDQQAVMSTENKLSSLQPELTDLCLNYCTGLKLHCSECKDVTAKVSSRLNKVSAGDQKLWIFCSTGFLFGMCFLHPM